MTRRQKGDPLEEWALGHGYRERSGSLSKLWRRVSHASGGLLGHHSGFRCHTSCYSWFDEDARM